jgi:hypothetical protein
VIGRTQKLNVYKQPKTKTGEGLKKQQFAMKHGMAAVPQIWLAAAKYV